MYCSRCGKEINLDAYVCPYCGGSTGKPLPYEERYHAPAPQQTNGYAIAGLILAFCIPLLGLIFGILGLKRSNGMNGEGKGLSIAAIIISSLELFIVLIILIVVVSALGVAASTMGAILI